MATGAKQAIAQNVRASKIARLGSPSTHKVTTGNATAAMGGHGPVRQDKTHLPTKVNA